MSKKCVGCGATLQNNDDNKPGFIPEIKEDSKYCRRCFRLIHYNELPKIVASQADYEKVINNTLRRNDLILYVIDIFALKTTLIKDMTRRLKDKDVIIVANKYDVLPKSTNITKVLNYIIKETKKFDIKILATHIVSSLKNLYIDDLINTIETFRFGRDVTVVGVANVGKSSLINAILKHDGPGKDEVTSSMIPGTTLDEIKIPFFSKNNYLIDTPGLINDKDVLLKLLPFSYKKIIPKHEIKPITFQIRDKEAFFVGGLTSISIRCKNNASMIFYVSNDLNIHRTNDSKVKDLFQNRLGTLLNPPLEEEKKFIAYQEKKFVFDGNKKKQIWFPGYGFVVVSGRCQLTVRYIFGTELYASDSII
ncbi:MAG: ribosome biogenesis GTPase YqeH [Acholeplasmatales bacterium]|nr:ribosome biogenesis GTPase YqeH [Acholeplasmatales bacterium]